MVSRSFAERKSYLETGRAMGNRVSAGGEAYDCRCLIDAQWHDVLSATEFRQFSQTPFLKVGAP